MTSIANADQSALLGLAQQLHCAQSEPQATMLLKNLSELPLEPFGIPNEALNNGPVAELNAATVDILLKVFYETIHRFPKLQENVERLALRWNYCETFNEGDFADLYTATGEIEKREAIGPFPANKEGFGLWGFVQRSGGERYIPEMLKYSAIFPRAHEEILYRLNQMQCFPKLELEESENLGSNTSYTGALQLSEPLLPGKKYPYTWKEQCIPLTSQHKQIEPTTTEPMHKIVTHHQVKPVTQPVQMVTEKAVELPIEVPEKVIKTPKLYPQKTKQKPSYSEPKIISKKPKKSFLRYLIAEKYEQPKNDDMPVLSPAIPSGNSNIGAPLPLPPEGGYGIAGNFYHRAALTGALSVGSNVSWHPYSYFFVRGGVSYNYLPGSGLSYSWGAGYDDWHPGTFSAQINNWGPLKPGDDPLKGAVANFGYKFVAEALKPYHLSGSASLNVPLSGDPSISTTWVWSPIEHWFARVTLSKSLTGLADLDWSYSFGYSDWHPFTFSLTYDNWGPNPLIGSSEGGDRVNFVKNGAITLSWSWAF